MTSETKQEYLDRQTILRFARFIAILNRKAKTNY